MIDYIMHLLNIIFLLGVITTIDCFIYIDISDSPIYAIKEAHELCTKNASVSSDCRYSCALEKLNAFGPQFDRVNATAFGCYRKKCAHVCWKSLGMTAKPTCAQADEFVDCFQNATTVQDAVLRKECSEKFPVKDIPSIDGKLMLIDPQIDNHSNMACFLSCLADGVHFFRDDPNDMIDLNCMNPNVRGDVEKKCERDNNQSNECERKAERIKCVLKTHGENIAKGIAEGIVKFLKMITGPSDN